MSAPSPFFAGTKLQYAWDSTSLSLLKACPRKYYFTMIEGWKPRGESVHLRFGILFHSGLELYDKAKAKQPDFSHDDLVDHVVDFLLTSTWDKAEDGTSGPWVSDHATKTRYNLVRSVVWYLEEYKDDVAKTIILANGTPAVELSFKLELPHLGPTGQPYLLTGHLDRLVAFGDDTYVMDRKTSGSTISAYYFRQFNPDTQMSQYTFASKMIYGGPVQGVIIDAAQIAVGFTAFSRGITARSDSQLDEWLENTLEWISLAERFAERERWPMNEASCGNYGGCPFRSVCDKNPAIRQAYLETDFEINPWNPLQIR